MNVSERVLSEIKTPNTPFTIETVNRFIELVREKYNYDMIDVDAYPQPERYPAIPDNKYDIQIIYSDVTYTGHFICVYYDPNRKTLYIYDSFFSNENRDQISEENFSILKNRFPMGEKLVYVQPKTEQYDETSSGPLAMAYATTLIFGETPAVYGLKMNTNHSDKAIHLREHIFEMFSERELSPFPR